MLIGLLPTTAFTLDLSSEELPVPVYSAAYAADVVVDGELDEVEWVTNGKMTSAEGSTFKLGFRWNHDGTIYVYVDEKLVETVNAQP